MKKIIICTAGGFTAGVLFTLIMLLILFPSMMIETRESMYSLEDTVRMIDVNSEEQGWAVLRVWDLTRRMQRAGYEDAPRVRVVELCHAENTYNVLKNPEDMFVSAIMPCRMSVYERPDGRVFVSRMNIGLMSRFFSSNVKRIMKGVEEDDVRILQDILKD